MEKIDESGKRETLADVVAWLRDPKIKNPMRKTWRDVLADRIEAAWRREKAEIEANALAVGGIVEAARHKPGNAAAMREALREAIGETCAGCTRDCDACVNLKSGWMKKAKAALSAPARNCDLPLVVDGPADNNADKAWFVFKQHNHDAYFDVSGLLLCIDWLFATAAQKGEGDGR